MSNSRFFVFLRILVNLIYRLNYKPTPTQILHSPQLHILLTFYLINYRFQSLQSFNDKESVFIFCHSSEMYIDYMHRISMSRTPIFNNFS